MPQRLATVGQFVCMLSEASRGEFSLLQHAVGPDETILQSLQQRFTSRRHRKEKYFGTQVLNAGECWEIHLAPALEAEKVTGVRS